MQCYSMKNSTKIEFDVKEERKRRRSDVQRIKLSTPRMPYTVGCPTPYNKIFVDGTGILRKLGAPLSRICSNLEDSRYVEGTYWSDFRIVSDARTLPFLTERSFSTPSRSMVAKSREIDVQKAPTQPKGAGLALGFGGQSGMPNRNKNNQLDV